MNSYKELIFIYRQFTATKQIESNHSNTMADENKESKKWTKEEVAKTGYRGKFENFKPDMWNKKGKRPQKKTGPSSANIPPPSDVKASDGKPAGGQKNDPLIADAIFGVDVSVAPIAPLEEFKTTHANYIQLLRTTFKQFNADEPQLDRKLNEAEFIYYGIVLFWIRVLELKAAKKGATLTSAEKDFRKAFSDQVLNVPQPIHTYLMQMGSVTDKMGKETDIDYPSLPVAVAQGMGGYHAVDITQDNHNLFEEIPTLGIAADAVMAVAGEGENPRQEVRVGLPAGAKVNENLLGFVDNVGPRRIEIRQRLYGQGITANAFPEFIENTRLNVQYTVSISDIINKFETFKNEKVIMSNMTRAGGESQIIQTKPVDQTQVKWTKSLVQPTSAADSSVAQMGASYVFGFQLHKEQGPGNDVTIAASRWSCIEADAEAEAPWVITQAWIETRNARRNLPQGIGTERFRGISMKQDIVTMNVVRRMIKTSR